MTMTQADEVRRLLVRHHDALALAQALALKLLDLVQADAPVSPDAMREARRFAGDALARIESGETYAQGLWESLGVDRRRARVSVPHERRGSGKPRP
jgi:hypothetical protein